MNTVIKSLKRIWFPEDVPRWFGLTVFLIYLAGLAGVAYVGVQDVRQDVTRSYWTATEQAFSALAGDVSAQGEDGAGIHRTLRDFAGTFKAQELRLVGADQKVMASIDASEEGAPVVSRYASASRPRRLERLDVPGDAHHEPMFVFRAPLALNATRPEIFSESRPAAQGAQPQDDTPGGTAGDAAGGTAGDAAGESGRDATGETGTDPAGQAVSAAPEDAQRNEPDSVRPDDPAAAAYLVMVVPQRVVGAVSLGDFAGPLSVVLAGCGALLLAYRRLRRQMRGVSRIAMQLATTDGNVEDAVHTLRRVDEADALAQQWNGLVSLVESLSAEVKRSQASTELTKALSQVSGGALRQALNAVPDSIALLVDGGRIDYANAAARRLLGVADGGESPPTLDELSPEGAGAKCVALLKEAQEESGQFETRAQVVETDDHETFLRVRVLPLRGTDAGSSCVVMVSDVSQQVRADKAREEFVSQVTHELRTPLTNIRAYTETLASGMFDDPKIVTECYNVITKETRRLARLIDDMLNVSQMEVGAIQLSVDEVDLRALLTDAVRDVRGLAEEKQIDLRLTLPSKLEPIRADKDKLNVVLNNLLGNALKYTPSGGNVVIGAQITGDKAMVTVKDNGIGISAKDQQRVFEKFARGDDPLVREQTGTGVGLYTAREIVRRHGGDIEVISAKGEGSTFVVRLPHEPSRAAV
ncbi:MAG: PAS domain-containing protein [Phycisphaerales bacterium]|nr:PAS domain-containing protein [Phycisphaerales bacterium]